MKTSVTMAAAFAGSLLLAPMMAGPSQAGSPPDLNSVGTTHASALTLIHGGGSTQGSGHMGGSPAGKDAQASAGRSSGHSGGKVGVQASSGRGHASHGQYASGGDRRYSHGRSLAYGGYGGGYRGVDCNSLRHYSWARYEACIGIY